MTGSQPSAIEDFHKHQHAEAFRKSRMKALALLQEMANRTVRCHLPMRKKIDGWVVMRDSHSKPLVIVNPKTGRTHARSKRTNPWYLDPDFEVPVFYE